MDQTPCQTYVNFERLNPEPGKKLEFANRDAQGILYMTERNCWTSDLFDCQVELMDSGTCICSTMYDAIRQDT